MSNGREKGGPHLLSLYFNFFDPSDISRDDNDLAATIYQWSANLDVLFGVLWLENGFHLFTAIVICSWISHIGYILPEVDFRFGLLFERIGSWTLCFIWFVSAYTEFAGMHDNLFNLRAHHPSWVDVLLQIFIDVQAFIGGCSILLVFA